MAYLQELMALGETMQVASKCGLGQSSPNAFLSIVEHFKDEIMGRAAPGAASSTGARAMLAKPEAPDSSRAER